MNKIKVLPVEGRMLLDIKRLESGVRDYIGYKDGELKLEPVYVDNTVYYRRALKYGDLKLYVEEKKEKQNKTV